MKPLAITVLCASFLCLTTPAGAEANPSGDTDFFLSAKPIWPENLDTAMNLFCGFRAAFPCPENGEAELRITGSSIYRIFLNGQFLGHGPARAGHGFYRVDRWPLAGKLKPKGNLLAIEAAGYNVNSFYVLDQPSFIQAEVLSGGKVMASTAGRGRPFQACLIPEKLTKVQRYSFQRTFVEYYRLTPAWADWRHQADASFQAVPCSVLPGKALLPRRVAYPRFACVQPAACVSRGKLKTGIKPARPWRDRALVNISPQFKGFPEKELAVVPSNIMQTIQSTDREAIGRPYIPGKKIALPGDTFQIFDLGTNLTGFIGLTVSCQKPTRFFVSFDEILKDEDVDFKRLSCTNVVCYELAPGDYSLETFEPYTLRYLKLHSLDNPCTVRGIYLREFVAGDADRATFAASDPNLNAIFEAARETYKQNTLDIFMDCPSRERAGWLCDSFFTARVAFDLCGNTTVEKNFFENYCLPPVFKFLPAGMLPMCYPADQYNGNFIPNWAMWFVVQLEEYHQRSGDRQLVKALEPRVMALFKYFEKFLNTDGLLEKLEKWVFVEWSAANKFVQDVNYPTNMLYTAALEAAARMYRRPELAAQARKMRKAILKQSYDGEYFVDNGMRKNGTLQVTRNRTEVCQYFAFYFDFASPETHGPLWTRLRDAFGPLRDAKAVHPEIHKANALIGNYLRIELLSRYGRVKAIKKELSDFYTQMAQLTGTLWENVGTYASCNHGFASHVAHSLYRDILGIYKVAPTSRQLILRFCENGLPWCRGTLMTPDGPVSLSRRDGPDAIQYRVKLPAGYTVQIINRTEKKLVRQ